MTSGFTCPLCGFRDASLPPFNDGKGRWYQEICPSCGTQFGLDDYDHSHFDLRRRWVEGGAKWWSSRPEPEGFDGLRQLAHAHLGYS